MTSGTRGGRDGGAAMQGRVRLTMRRAGFPLALALIALTNAVALGGVLRNRRGVPDAVLTLTERELTIGYVGEEDTGLALHVDWNQRWDGSDPGWLDRGKLESLGFDCSVPPDDPRAELHYGKALPLQRYAALEFEGESWRRWLADQEREIEKLRGKAARHEEAESNVKLREKELATSRVASSRLMLVDVGRDPDALRRLHPDRTRFIVAPAAIYIYYSSGWKSADGTVHPPVLQGRVSEILVQEIHVPLSLRPILDQLRREDDKAADKAGKGPLERRFGPSLGQAPRYEVILKYGRRHEPWIAEIHRLS